MFRRIFDHIVVGFWQGVGVEVSFFLLWIGWHLFHGKMVHRFDPEHWFHKIHDYFTT
jgi:hypothetical protein